MFALCAFSLVAALVRTEEEQLQVGGNPELLKVTPGRANQLGLEPIPAWAKGLLRDDELAAIAHAKQTLDEVEIAALLKAKERIRVLEERVKKAQVRVDEMGPADLQKLEEDMALLQAIEQVLIEDTAHLGWNDIPRRIGPKAEQLLQPEEVAAIRDAEQAVNKAEMTALQNLLAAHQRLGVDKDGRQRALRGLLQDRAIEALPTAQRQEARERQHEALEEALQFADHVERLTQLDRL